MGFVEYSFFVCGGYYLGEVSFLFFCVEESAIIWIRGRICFFFCYFRVLIFLVRKGFIFYLDLIIGLEKECGG